MRRAGSLLLILALFGPLLNRIPAADSPKLFGALQSTMERAATGFEAGWRVAVISVSWDAFEPEEGRFDAAVVERARQQAAAYRALGYRLQLDLGMQYPPDWIFRFPASRFRNQYGDEHASGEPGRNVANGVFNQAVRDRMEVYVGAVFRHLGTDWDWVRLGGGFFGEVNFPLHRYRGKINCYWAFDDIAQGKRSGLPPGIRACPTPGWKPGDPDAAGPRKFLEWYLGALQNYHDWQIRTVRRWFAGEICMLYGSWGIRPGGLEQALETHLNGSSPAEAVGEISSGYDWERMIGGLGDSKVIVYCTWVDAPRRDCDDEGTDQTRWSPIHWQAFLAARNPRRLKVWGENTGRGDLAALDLTFERMHRYAMMGVLWAFESDLFADGRFHYATFADFSSRILAAQPASLP